MMLIDSKMSLLNEKNSQYDFHKFSNRIIEQENNS